MLKRIIVKLNNAFYRIFLKNILKLSKLGHGFIVSGAESGENFEHIYNNSPQGALLIGKCIDSALLNLPSVKATRERKEVIKNLLWNEIQNNRAFKRKTRILDLASGGARYLRELRCEHASGDVESLCIDKDKKCVYLGRKLASNECVANLKFFRGDIFKLGHLKKMSARIKWVPNVIVVSGLFIYFNDQTVEKVLRETFEVLPKGGLIIFQSYEKLTSRKLMRKTSVTSKGDQWTLYYRKPEYWRALLSRLGYKEIFIMRDEWLMNNVCSARKSAT